MKYIENEDISQTLLKRIIDLIPKNEMDEFHKKIGTLTSKKKLSNLSQRQFAKNENKICIGNTPKPTIKCYDTLENGDILLKKEIKSKKVEAKSITEHISLIEENEEEDNADDSVHKKLSKKRKKLRKVKKDILNKTFCGNKRNISTKNEKFSPLEDKIKEKGKRKNSFVSKNTRSNKKIDYTNNNINSLFKKNEEERKAMSEKEILSNLVKRKGFMKVFECLTLNPLNREKPLEKKIDDIINSIGLLRTSLILFQIKFQEIEKSKNINTNNIININSNSNNISTNFPKNDDDIDIVIDEINDSNSNANQEIKHVKASTPAKKRNILNNSKEIKNKCLTKSKSVISKDLNKKDLDLEFDIHLQKDKNGNIYKFYKQYYRENKGKNIYVFYCADKKCKAKANYYVGNMSFEVNRDHSMKYEDHCYIKNRNRFDKYKQIIDEFKQRSCHEAQVFKKENGTRLVKWYD